MYRFNLRGTNVECDSVQELLAALGRESASVQPATPTTRARKQKQATISQKGRLAWRAAALHAQRSNGRLTVNQARSQLAKDLGLKQKLLAEVAGG